MKKFITLLIVITYTVVIYAQSTGYVNGAILDSIGGGISGAHIDIVDISGAPTGLGVLSDIDGRYTLADLHPGTYNLMYSSLHRIGLLITGVLVGADEATGMNIVMKTASGKEYEIVSYEKPLINDQDTRLDQRVSQKDIHNMDINDIAAQQAGVSQRDAGSPITIEGSYEYEVLYMYNGIPLMNKRPLSSHGLP